MGRREKIIALNDGLRKTFKGGRVQMTTAVYNLDPQLRGRAIWAMARYSRFADDSEHDWGVFIFAGYSFEWHIECRNANGTGLSTDPADPEKTFRVLTLYVGEGPACKGTSGWRASIGLPCIRAKASSSSSKRANLIISWWASGSFEGCKV
jgi:hypothetical protein